MCPTCGSRPRWVSGAEAWRTNPPPAQVARGYDSLGGYKLHDVVQLGNQSAVVVHVGTSTLRVLTHLGDVQEVEPVKLKGKKSDAKAGPGGGSAMDKAGAEILVNDPVTIVQGAPLRVAGGGGLTCSRGQAL